MAQDEQCRSSRSGESNSLSIPGAALAARGDSILRDESGSKATLDAHRRGARAGIAGRGRVTDGSNGRELMMVKSPIFTIRVDKRVYDYFRSEGLGYQTRMNSVLAAFVADQERPSKNRR
ncbi:MAG: BrnA antitoxin family protein [Inquilinus sp.]|uniref:BrnA antitoxin family protein n=1 Tax=Inquilinus sp. TaxID=1932117 RepID=UPI003F35D18F